MFILTHPSCCCIRLLPDALTQYMSSGVRYGPPGGKRLVYFVDDMNMALVDKYDTQSAIEIMRQSIDYRGWFEKSKIFLKARAAQVVCTCSRPGDCVSCLPHDDYAVRQAASV